jgi:hypothetical protein
MLERVWQRRDMRRLVVGHPEEASFRPSRAVPLANTSRHGWMFEFDGACWARERASSTDSRGTGRGKKHPCRMALKDRSIEVRHHISARFEHVPPSVGTTRALCAR